MSTKPAPGHHPHAKPEIEQSILDSKAALATSPDKVAQQQAYPDALAHDQAQESLDNQTGLQEAQPAAPAKVVPPAPDKPKKDKSTAAKQVQDEVKASGELATAKKEDLVGKPPVILTAEHGQKNEATSVDFGKAGHLKVESVGRPQYGVAGEEYSITVRVAPDRTVTLHHIPADLLK